MSKGKPLSPEQAEAIRQAVLSNYQDQAPPAGKHEDGGEDQSYKAPADPAVGYKSPPVSTRFKPGQSGNPKGRPRKGARDGSSSTLGNKADAPALLEIHEVFLSQFARVINVNEAGQSIEIAAKVALIRAAIVNALKGNAFAQKTMLDHLLKLEQQKATSLAVRLEAWRQHKERGYETLARIEAGESELPPPLPHPDDIILEYGREPLIVGPIVPEVQAIVDLLLMLRGHLLLEHVYFKRYAPGDAYEREAFQQRLELNGLERCEDASIPTGPMMAITLLEGGLPPRLRWSLPELVEQVDKHRSYTRRQLEHRLTKGRKLHRIPLARGAFYPSAVYDVRLWQMSLDLAEQQQAKTRQAEDKAREQGRPFVPSSAEILTARMIQQTFREHGFLD